MPMLSPFTNWQRRGYLVDQIEGRGETERMRVYCVCVRSDQVMAM